MAGIPSKNKPKLVLRDANAAWTRNLFSSGILKELANVNGIIFAYTPAMMQAAFSANYGTYDTTHSVYQQQYYVNTPNPTISMQAYFVSNTIEEAKYNIACLHFLKTMTKMDFGSTAGLAGTPPPILHFSAYGEYNYKNVPVVVSGVDYTFADDADLVTVDVDGSPISIPTSFAVSITMMMQQNPEKVSREFSFANYASGAALKNGMI
jgi:hypothetical protein|tara:strand:+ start:144 stop:767 length:624 start_codon:yes stop_codon:yes gene_type:complete